MKVLTVAKYLRLSAEDNDLKTAGKLESNSIANQRNLLDSYISRTPELAAAEVLEFCDDGWSGTNFERPGVQKMLEGVRKGEINCIIVKDISRFGRNYLEVGNYISRVFPFLGVRFIAINDNLDSINPQDIDSLETSFKTLMYDLYSRDLSRKTKSAREMRAKRGLNVSSIPPYGYAKSQNNKNQLQIDPETADTVRLIFRLMGDGTSTELIARHLNDLGIPTPSQYKSNHGYPRNWNYIGEENFWNPTTVANILRDEQYLGKTIYGKSAVVGVGSSHSCRLSRENWIVVENTHEAIVTQGEFDRAQASFRKRLKCNGKESRSGNILKYKVRCGICGRAMARIPKKNISYSCRTPRFTAAWSCPTESVLESDLVDMVAQGLRVQAETAVEMSQLWEELHCKKKKDAATLRKAMTALQTEQARQELKFNTLYESLIMGEISTEKYLAEKAILNQAKEKTAERIAALDAEMSSTNQDGSHKNRFIEAFKKYTNVECLSADVVAEVLDCILIFPDRRIEIVWKFQDEFEKLVTELGESPAQ